MAEEVEVEAGREEVGEEEPVVKEIGHKYYDKNDEVNKFYDKYTNRTGEEIDVFDENDKSDKEFNLDNIKLKDIESILGENGKTSELIKLFEHYISSSNENEENEENENNVPVIEENYAEDILEQISVEPKNKVAIFKYKVYLYNIHIHLIKLILNNDNDFSKFIYEDDNTFKLFFEKLKETSIHNRDKYFSNIKNLIKKNTDKEINNNESIPYNYEYMDMYIPKLLNKKSSELNLSGGSGRSGSNPYWGGEGSSEFDNSESRSSNFVEDPEDEIQPPSIKTLADLKKVEDKDKNEDNPPDKQIKNNFINNGEIWKTVLNSNKNKYYGFNENTPTLDGRKYLLSRQSNSDKIQKYIDKCNDLQIFYIKKHIELYDIFKLMKKYIDFNIEFNDIIKKLVDPKYLKRYKGKNLPINLPPLLKDISNKLKEENDVSTSAGNQSTNIFSKPVPVAEAVDVAVPVAVPLENMVGGANVNPNANDNNFPVIPNNNNNNNKIKRNNEKNKNTYIIGTEIFDKFIKKTSDSNVPSLKVDQTLYLTFGDIRFMITLKEIVDNKTKLDIGKTVNNLYKNTAKDYIFHNILGNEQAKAGGDIKDNLKKKIEDNIKLMKSGKEAEANYDVEQVTYVVDSIESYEILQAIKRIQLLNEQSLLAIIGKKEDINNPNSNDRLDKIIAEYKINVDSYGNIKNLEAKQDVMEGDQHTLWQNFNTSNNKDTHFDINIRRLEQPQETYDTDTIQSAIYKCYDLQILYLVKHLEIIEMFKLVFYFYDMLLKKIGVLFLILALYKRYKIDLNDMPISIKIGNFIKDMPVMVNLGSKTSQNVPPIEAAVGAVVGGSMAGGSFIPPPPPPPSIANLKPPPPLILLETQISKNKEKTLIKKNAIEAAFEKYDENFTKITEKYNNNMDNIKVRQQKILRDLHRISSEENDDDPKVIKIFNILLNYFKIIKKESDANIDSFSKIYNYVDKLLIEILQKYLAVVMIIIRNKDENKYIDNSIDKNKEFNLLKNIYYDLEEYIVNIDISRTSIRKKRSDYGVVKIGQFSKDDLFSVDKMLKTFHESFREKYKKDLEIDKSEIDKFEIDKGIYKGIGGISFPFKFKKESKQINELKTEIQQLQKINAKDVDIDPKINDLSEVYKQIFTTLQLDYIAESIDENKFTDENIQNNIALPQTSKQQHILSYLEKLHKIYLSNDENFKVLSGMEESDDEAEPAVDVVPSSGGGVLVGGGKKLDLQLKLLDELVKSLGYKNLESASKDSLFITKPAYDKLRLSIDKLKAEADLKKAAAAEALKRKAAEDAAAAAAAALKRKAVEDAAASKRKADELEEERLRKLEEERLRKLEEEENARRRDEELRRAEELRLAKLEEERVEALRLANLEAARVEAADAADRERVAREAADAAERERVAREAREARENTRRSLCEKIKNIIDIYKQQGDLKAKIDLELQGIATEETDNIKDITNLLELINKLIEKFGDDFIANCVKDENFDLIEFTEKYLDKLLEIILGAARVFVNIRQNGGGEGNLNNLLAITNNTINFKDGAGTCNNNNNDKFNEDVKYGPYKAIYPEVPNKNTYIFQSLFEEATDENTNATKTAIEAYRYGSILQQNLYKTIENGKSVVIFGFGFSGSGKTYTLIEGNEENDKSILIQYIEKYRAQIESIDFVEIYPENNTIYASKANTKYSKSKGGGEAVGADNNGIFSTDEGENETYKDLKIDDNFNLYDSIQLTDGEDNNAIIKERLKQIEQLRIKNFRILPTPNNPVSSRSFLQITIKMKNDEGNNTGGGQLVLFDMPGTENTVNIKKIMLGGDKIFTDFNNRNSVEEIQPGELDIMSKKDFDDKKNRSDKEHEYYIDKKKFICRDILFNENYYSKKYCDFSNIYLGLEDNTHTYMAEDIKDLDKQRKSKTNDKIKDNFIIRYITFYNDYKHLIKKITFLKKYKDYNPDQIKAFNILFKYFTLHIKGFEFVGIEFLDNDFRKEGKDTPIEKNITGRSKKLSPSSFKVNTKVEDVPEVKPKTNEDVKNYIEAEIAKIGIEMALFFNGKTGNSLDIIKEDEEIYFLNDKEFKQIYETFIERYIKKKEHINIPDGKTKFELSEQITDDDKKHIGQIFNVGFLKEESNEVQSKKREEQKVKINEINEKYNKLPKNRINIEDKAKEIKKVVEEFEKSEKKAKQYDSNIKAIFFKAGGIVFNYNASSTFYDTIFKEGDKINTSSPLIKYILLILQFIYDNSEIESFETKTLEELNTSFNKIIKKYNDFMDEAFIPNPNPNPKKKSKKVIKSDAHNMSSTYNKFAENNIEDLENFVKERKKYDRVNIFYRASVYFIYKYIQFIVKQGSAIVTTLEHLKFFFLSHASEIDNYNRSNVANSNKCFTISEEFISDGKFNSMYKPANNVPNIFTNEQKYIIPSTPINEEINIGNMSKYGLLPILQYLAGDQTDLFQLQMKQIADTNNYTPMLTGNVAKDANTLNSVFIMFAHINTTTENKNENEISLVCESAKDTLVYINSISSIPQIYQFDDDELLGGFYNNYKYKNKNNKNKYKELKNYKEILSNIKKNKENYIDNHNHKRFLSIKNLSNTNKKRLFSRRTKKYIK